MNLLLDFLNHAMGKRHLSQTKFVVLPEGWQPEQLKGEIHRMLVLPLLCLLFCTNTAFSLGAGEFICMMNMGQQQKRKAI